MAKELTEKESLALISSMIQNTKTNVRAQGHLYILWGVLVPLTALAHYYFVQYPMSFPPGMVWMFTMPITGIIHGILVSRLTKSSRTITFLDEAMKYIWSAFILGIVVVIILMFAVGPQNAQPVFLILYGIGTFASGGILSIRSLTVGGIVCFVLAALSGFVTADQQLLLLAAGTVCGFLIPGLLIHSTKSNQA